MENLGNYIFPRHGRSRGAKVSTSLLLGMYALGLCLIILQLKSLF